MKIIYIKYGNYFRHGEKSKRFGIMPEKQSSFCMITSALILPILFRHLVIGNARIPLKRHDLFSRGFHMLWIR